MIINYHEFVRGLWQTIHSGKLCIVPPPSKLTLYQDVRIWQKITMRIFICRSEYEALCWLEYWCILGFLCAIQIYLTRKLRLVKYTSVSQGPLLIRSKVWTSQY